MAFALGFALHADDEHPAVPLGGHRHAGVPAVS
jgi:hypothetical protein